MSRLAEQFAHDRALRDAARKNVLADVELLKQGWNARGFIDRALSRIGGGAQDVIENAGETSEIDRGVISALIGAIVLWFASGAILEILDEGEDVETETQPDIDQSGDTPRPEQVETADDTPLNGDNHE